MKRLARVLALAGLAMAAPAAAADLYPHGAWASMASDRAPVAVGDSLTVVVDESSVASDSAENTAKKSSHFGGSISADARFSHTGALDLGSGFDGAGATSREHKMLAQISVVVDQILPNGDLHIAGSQALKINGEHTNIRIRGRVRPADIGADNTVPSTRIADATIDYDGAGFVARSARPGILTRIFDLLRLP